MKNLDPKSVWLFFFHSLGLGFVFLVLFGWYILFSSVGSLINGRGLSFSWIFLAIIAYIIISYISAKLTYSSYKYELREDAFRKESGIIWKRYVSIPYERIQNVDIHRGLLARILGLSDLMIQTAGYSGGGERGLAGAVEGRLPGVNKNIAEQLRDELIRRARGARSGV